MSAVTTLDQTSTDSAVASNGLEVSWLVAMRHAMGHEELERALAPHGVYAQRQRGRYLVRVKVPIGRLSMRQLAGLAELTKSLPDLSFHLTTRQDVELNFVTLAELPPLLDSLAAIGLGSRESCGNTVRNVTTCPLAGVCPNESFDVRPYAAQLVQRFSGLGFRSMLPRKFKIALSGCQADCARAQIHDLGVVARRAGSNGTAPSFDVYVGGGLGALPKLAAPLASAVPASSLSDLAAALIRIFQREGDFEHRQRARLKFVVAKAGIAQVRDWLTSEWDGMQATQSESEGLVESPLALPPLNPAGASSGSPYHGLALWQQANVVAQRQVDRYAAFVALPGGNVTASQLGALSGICAEFHLDGLRITVDQDLVITDVPSAHLRPLHEALAAAGLAEPGARGAITCCPGTAVCRKAITSARSIGEELRYILPAHWQADPNFAGTSIKISGCPNSCAQPQIATIGLVGCATHAHGRLYPAYQLYIGGGTIDGQTAFGRMVGRVPARRVPDALRSLVDVYQGGCCTGETFARFLRRVDVAAVRSILDRYAGAPEESSDCYVDWGAQQQFSLFDSDSDDNAC